MAGNKVEHTFWYSVARALAAFVFTVLFPTHYHGKEILNAVDAPYIIIANHQSWLDPVAIARCCRRYEIRFLGKSQLVQSKVAGYFIKQLHMISVDRHATDIQAMRQCTQVLKKDQVLGIFPEGTRHQEHMMDEVESGVAVLALRSRVPVVPVYFTCKFKLFRRTDVYVGQPMAIEDLCEEGSNNETAQKLVGRIRETFFDMRDSHAQKALTE